MPLFQQLLTFKVMFPPGLQQSAAVNFEKLLNGRRENVAAGNHYLQIISIKVVMSILGKPQNGNFSFKE